MLERRAAVLAGVAATALGVGALVAYRLYREDDGGEDGSGDAAGKRRGKGHASSRQTTVEMRIDSKDAPVVIGRRGENIKDIQFRTNTSIHFKDEVSTETERVLEIRGLPHDVQTAQVLLHQVITAQPRAETRRLEVNYSAVGRIIGRGGENIRRLMTSSRCKIDIQRGSDERGKTQITLRGSPEQLTMAEKLIQEQLIELETMEKKAKDSAGSRSPRHRSSSSGGGSKATPTLFLTAENGGSASPAPEKRDTTERLVQVAGEKSIGVFVSAISDPGRFFVQKVGPKSIGLDKLVQEMTEYYQSESNRASHVLRRGEVGEGDVVAAQWPGDDRFYRARVVEVLAADEYDEEAEPELDLDFVDFGDCDKKPLGEVFDLRTNFLRLSYQAIECCLAGVEPTGGRWSEEAVNAFERLSKCAQWTELQATIVDSKKSGSALIPMVQLVDTEGEQDVNLGQELVRLGFAREIKYAPFTETLEDVKASGDAASGWA